MYVIIKLVYDRYYTMKKPCFKGKYCGIKLIYSPRVV